MIFDNELKGHKNYCPSSLDLLSACWRTAVQRVVSDRCFVLRRGAVYWRHNHSRSSELGRRCAHTNLKIVDRRWQEIPSFHKIVTAFAQDGSKDRRFRRFGSLGTHKITCWTANN